MSANFSTALRNARANAVISTIDAGTPPATISFYSGTKPATTGGAITTQTLLGTVTLSKPCATVSNGVLTFATIADDSVADNTGTIAWARMLSGAGDFVMDTNCGVSGSGAVFIFNSLSVIAGGVIGVVSGSCTEGNL